MPRDSSGNYTLPLGNPVVDGTIIDVNWANPTMSDIAVQLNNVLTRDGLLGPIAPFFIVDGTAALPGLAFISQNGSGLWRDATQVGLSVGGVAKQVWSSAGSQVNGNFNVTGDLSSAGNISFTGSLITVTNSIQVGQPIPAVAALGANYISIGGGASSVFAIGALGISYGGLVANSADGLLKLHAAGRPLVFSVGNTVIERMRIDTNGNVGIGVVPNAWSATHIALQVGTGLSLWTATTVSSANLSNNVFFDGSVRRAVVTGAASEVAQSSGFLVFSNAASVAAGSILTMTERMRIDATGNVGIGVANRAGSRLNVTGPTSNRLISWTDAVNSTGYLGIDVGRTMIGSETAITFQTGGIANERMRIDAAGNVGIGVSAPAGKLHINGTGGTNTTSIWVSQGATPALEIVSTSTSGGFGNAAASIMRLARNTATLRSIGADGTINASGADYAEYEPNGGQTFAKGDVVGFDANGVLTPYFNEAVRFGIKSTDPSYVGGDTWGEGLTGDTLEAARQNVDRVAYSGKVPVNVWNAAPGGYIIAAAGTDGYIEAVFVADVDFTQYKRAVGRVNCILDDGRAEVAVIVH